MASFVQMALRGSQFLWTFLTTALIGNVIAEAFSGNPSSINYAIFVSVFCWIALIYGGLATVMESLAIPIALIVMDTLATLFTFIAGVVLAAGLNVHSCNNQSYIHSNHLTNGSHNPTKRCHELQASTAFFWFLFASFLGSVIMGILSSPGTGIGRGVRRGPAMSQV
ncbi:putative Non-classical export protein 2 [Amylocarpus encephaloides]|uniref:Non-classical export protein 2 n=1 Tax=Amylocarpus encephaloides TaxID=45428 RepID=A0A9P7YM71_9HELO|nr:putative Non-classical export protein 2 [Amylocarpus encephaloides]